MQEILSNLASHYPFLAEYKYLLLFAAGTIEGFSSILVAGFLVSVHSLNLVPTFLLMSLAETINGFLWYGVGYWGGAKPLDWILNKKKGQRQAIQRIRDYFERFTGGVILLAKMTFSLTIITQILVGSLKYRFKKFAFYNVIGSIGWVTMVLFVGYSFGEGYKVFFTYWKSVTHLVLYVILALVLIYWLRVALRKLLFHYLDIMEHVQKIGVKFKQGLDKLSQSVENEKTNHSGRQK